MWLRIVLLAGAVTISLQCFATPCRAQQCIPDVTTHHYDSQRTGANIFDTGFDHRTVASGMFGKLWEFPVRGNIYAQPLLATAVDTLIGHRRCLIIIATGENLVYAFDALKPDPKPVWTYDAGFGRAAFSNRVYLWESTGDNKPNQTITPAIGIIGTPVIDAQHSTIYFVAMTQEGDDINAPKFVHTLHAVDLRSGTSRMMRQIKIDLEGFSFRSDRQNQRAALALANDRVYIAWASFDDRTPFVGFVQAYFTADATQPLQPAGQFQVTGTRLCPDFVGGTRREKGGIWHSGGGPAVDNDNFVYVVTGDEKGHPDNGCPGRDFDSSVVKLLPDLKMKDFYTPSYQKLLNELDVDLSVAGPMIPADQPDEHGKPTKLLIHGSKAGIIYVLNRENLGQYDEHSNRIIQGLHVFPDACSSDVCQQRNAAWDPMHIHTTPVYWKAPDGPRIYVASDYNLGVRAFRFKHEKLDPQPVAVNFYPRAPISQMSLSADGDRPGTGILWFISSPVGTIASYPGILYAFNAENLEMLYSSESNPFDRLGDYPRFNVPVVANELVYVPTFSNKLAVYGLCRPDRIPCVCTASVCTLKR